jgi:hypothetical protein
MAYQMPWGKYVSVDITKVPKGYLRHIRNEFNFMAA